MFPSNPERGLWPRLHFGYVQPRRARALAQYLSRFIPPDSRVLDVGCGDGQVCRLIDSQRPDVAVTGIDVIMRDNSYFPVKPFDGVRIPVPDASQDVVMLIDVLHHSDDPVALLREAKRVARKTLVVKDVMNDSFLADFTLRIMDVMANRRY